MCYPGILDTMNEANSRVEYAIRKISSGSILGGPYYARYMAESVLRTHLTKHHRYEIVQRTVTYGDWEGSSDAELD